MRIKITAPGIYNSKGEEIPVGTELTVKDEPTAWAGRYVVLSGGGEGKTAVTNPKAAKKAAKEEPAAVTYNAEERDGAWIVVDGDGQAHGKPISEEDAKAFNALSDDEKADLLKDEA